MCCRRHHHPTRAARAFVLAATLSTALAAQAVSSDGVDTAKADIFPIEEALQGKLEDPAYIAGTPFFFEHLNYSVFFSPGKVLGIDKWAHRELITDNTASVAAEIHYTALPTDYDAFAADYDLPSISLGFRYNFNHGTKLNRVTENGTSVLGNVFTIYLKFSRPIWQRRKWEAGYYMGTGAAYSHTKYDKGANLENEFIGSHWNIFFTAGFYGTYMIDQHLGIIGGIDYAHHSNGAMNRPNKGNNYLGPFVGLRYYPQSRQTNTAAGKHAVTHSAKAEKELKTLKGFYLEFTGGIGGKTLLTKWFDTQFHRKPSDPEYRTDKFEFYGAFSLQTDLLYRYARRWASGIGVDVFYGDYANHEVRYDTAEGRNKTHSPWSVGIAAKHEIFYHNFSVRCGIGMYLYRHMGEACKENEKPYYERVGVYYSFPKLRGASIGFSVNAHLTKADFTELSISYPIKL